MSYILIKNQTNPIADKKNYDKLTLCFYTNLSMKKHFLNFAPERFRKVNLSGCFGRYKPRVLIVNVEYVFKFVFSSFFLSGPFTQLVWSNTKELGVGRACSRSGRTIVVANYLPRGNVNGQYANNVHMNQFFLPANKKKLDSITRQARVQSVAGHDKNN